MEQTMTINKFFLHTQFYNWDNQEKNIVFLTPKNFKKILDSSDEFDCHSSIEDLTLINTLQVIDNSKEVHVIDYNLLFPDLESFQFGRAYNHLRNCSEKVYNFDWIEQIELDSLDLFNQRTYKESCIWSYGCSITNGKAVDNSDKYTTLLSKKLQLPLIDLSESGSSINFMANKILKTDINKGDTVIWGLTSLSRFEYNENWKVMSRSIGSYKDIDIIKNNIQIDYFDSLTHTMTSIHSITNVINFCNKIGANLYIANLMDKTWLPIVFKKVKHFIDLSAEIDYNSKLKFIDVGSDNIHPGPKQHSYYAQELYKFIKGNDNGKTI